MLVALGLWLSRRGRVAAAGGAASQVTASGDWWKLGSVHPEPISGSALAEEVAATPERFHRDSITPVTAL